MKKFLPLNSLLILLSGFAAYIFLYRLGVAPFDNWDEAWYAEVTKQLIHTRELVALTWNGALFLDKPPLFMWIASIFSSVIGLSELAVRLPSAISAIVITYLVTRHALFKFGWLPGLITFSTLVLNNVFVWRARSGNVDLLLTLFFVLIYFVRLGTLKYKYALLGLLLANIYLTKASVAMVPFGILVITEFFSQPDLRKMWRSYLLGLLCFVIPVSLWLGIGYLKSGWIFPEYFLFRADQGVGDIALSAFKWEYFSYIYYALQRRFFYVFVIGLTALILGWKKVPNMLLILFAVTLPLWLSFTSRNNNWYLIPAFPFISLVAGYGTYSFLRLFRQHWVVTAGVLILSSYVSYKTYIGNIIPVMHTASAAAQEVSGEYLRTHTNVSDRILRLDHLYPSTIYYADRQVLSSPAGETSHGFFLSREEAVRQLDRGNIRWAVGTSGDVAGFAAQLSVKFEITKLDGGESVLHIL